MNQEKAVEIVDWSLTHWQALAVGVLAVVITAFVVAAVTEWYKSHRNKKTEVKVEGWLIQKALAFTALLFGGLEYALPFLQQNLTVLSNLKYVGGFVVSVYAAANFLYAMKFKSWFKAVQAYLEQRRAKLEAKASGVPTEQSQPLEQPILTQPDNPFEATTQRKHLAYKT